MGSENDSMPPVFEDRASLNECDHKSWELGLSGMPLRCSDCGHVFDSAEAAERDTEDRRIYEDAMGHAPQGYAGVVPTGGGLVGVDYYFTVNVGTADEPIYQTCVRRVVISRDAVVTCKGNTLVIEHPGVADTFRIGRVMPVDAA
jgi:hypothetical protein